MTTLEARLVEQCDGATEAGQGTVDDVVVERHVDGVFRFLRVLGADREVAEDLTQEAFAVVWQKGKQGLPRRALGTFLRRTARFLWLAHQRDRRRAESAISALALQSWEQEGVDDGEELVAATRACVQRLRGRAARAIELAYGRDEGRDAIAGALGLQPNGVKTLLARTRRWLEQCIRRGLS